MKVLVLRLSGKDLAVRYVSRLLSFDDESRDPDTNVKNTKGQVILTSSPSGEHLCQRIAEECSYRASGEIND